MVKKLSCKRPNPIMRHLILQRNVMIKLIIQVINRI